MSPSAPVDSRSCSGHRDTLFWPSTPPGARCRRRASPATVIVGRRAVDRGVHSATIDGVVAAPPSSGSLPKAPSNVHRPAPPLSVSLPIARPKRGVVVAPSKPQSSPFREQNRVVAFTSIEFGCPRRPSTLCRVEGRMKSVVALRRRIESLRCRPTTLCRRCRPSGMSSPLAPSIVFVAVRAGDWMSCFSALRVAVSRRGPLRSPNGRRRVVARRALGTRSVPWGRRSPSPRARAVERFVRDRRPSRPAIESFCRAPPSKHVACRCRPRVCRCPPDRSDGAPSQASTDCRVVQAPERVGAVPPTPVVVPAARRRRHRSCRRGSEFLATVC